MLFPNSMIPLTLLGVFHGGNFHGEMAELLFAGWIGWLEQRFNSRLLLAKEVLRVFEETNPLPTQRTLINISEKNIFKREAHQQHDTQVQMFLSLESLHNIPPRKAI